MKAIILARVSSKEQEENNSIPSQLRRLKEYVVRYGFSESEEYALVESSTKATRKEFEKIVEQIRFSPETVALIVDTIDRLQRSFRESVMLDELRQNSKVELHFLRENLIINNTSNSSEILRWDMGVMFAKSYVTQLSDNVRRGNEQKYLNGEWCSGAPFGYSYVKHSDGKKWIEPDENAHIVRDIYKWYASASYSMFQIRKRLKAEHNLVMAKSQINRILLNPFYYGVMKIREKYYPHSYAPLISQDLYDAAQDTKVGFHKKKYKYAGLPYYYRGLIACDVCGCTVTPERSKGYVYYHCTQYKGKHQAPYIREEELTKQLYEAFAAIQPNADEYEQAMQSLKASNSDKALYRANTASRLQSELARVEKRLERLSDLYLDDEAMDKDEYSKRKARYKQDKKDILNKLSKLDTCSDEFYSTLQKIVQICRNAPDTFESSKLEPRRELLQLVLQNLELHDRELRWKYKKPFDVMASCKKTQNWLGVRDSNPRMPGPKPGALPLGQPPLINVVMYAVSNGFDSPSASP